MKVLFFLCIFRITAINCETVTKTWTATAKWSQPSSWLNDRPPCGNQRILLPSNGAIYIDKSLSAREINLPSNGYVIFDKDMTFDLKSSPSSNREECRTPNGDADYVAHLFEQDFYNPQYWSTSLSGKVFKGSDTIGNPIPHSERVPCSRDSVRFPSGSTFKTRLKLVEQMTVSSIIIGSKSYDSLAFNELLKTDIGKLLFTYSTTDRFQLLVDSSKANCDQDTGCACGNERPLILSNICAFVAASCPKLTCNDGIKPIGFCCPICGTVLKITGTDNYKFDLVDNLLKTYQMKNEYTKAESYIHVVSNDMTQVIFVDSVNGSGSQSGHKLAKAFAEYLHEDSQPGQPNLYAIRTITMMASGDELSSSASRVMIWIVVLFAIGLSMGTIYYHRHMTWPELRTNVSNCVHSVRLRVDNLIGRGPNSGQTLSTGFNFVRFRESDDRVELAGIGLVGVAPRPPPEVDPSVNDEPGHEPIHLDPFSTGPAKPPRSLRGSATGIVPSLLTVDEEASSGHFSDTGSFGGGSINSVMLGARDHSQASRDLDRLLLEE